MREGASESAVEAVRARAIRPVVSGRPLRRSYVPLAAGVAVEYNTMHCDAIGTTSRGRGLGTRYVF